MITTQIYVKEVSGKLSKPKAGSKLPFIVVNHGVFDDNVLSYIVSWFRKDIDLMQELSLNSVPIVQFSDNGVSTHTVGVLQYKKTHPGTKFNDRFSGLAPYKTESFDGYVQFLDSKILDLQKGDRLTVKTVVPGKFSNCSLLEI
jgi:hypothetical protein